MSDLSPTGVKLHSINLIQSQIQLNYPDSHRVSLMIYISIRKSNPQSRLRKGIHSGVRERTVVVFSPSSDNHPLLRRDVEKAHQSVIDGKQTRDKKDEAKM